MSRKHAVDKVLAEIETWRSGRIWGAKSIGQIAGVSIETVARWAELPDCPIKRIGGRFFVTRDALVARLTSKEPV